MDDARREALERWDMAREEYLYPYDRAGRMRNAGNELARLLREDAATYEAVRTTVDAAPLAAAEQFVALCTRHDEDAVAVRLVCELRAALLAVLVAAGRGEGEGPQPKEVMPHADGDSAAAPVSVAPSPAPAVPSGGPGVADVVALHHAVRRRQGDVDVMTPQELANQAWGFAFATLAPSRVMEPPPPEWYALFAVPSLADDPKAVRIWGERRAAESARSTGEGARDG